MKCLRIGTCGTSIRGDGKTDTATQKFRNGCWRFLSELDFALKMARAGSILENSIPCRISTRYSWCFVSEYPLAVRSILDLELLVMSLLWSNKVCSPNSQSSKNILEVLANHDSLCNHLSRSETSREHIWSRSSEPGQLQLGRADNGRASR